MSARRAIASTAFAYAAVQVAPARVAAAQVAATRVATPQPARPAALASVRVQRAVLDTMRAVLGRAVADSAFPGAYAVVGDARGATVGLGAGRIDWAPDAPRPDSTTLWDLASLTKVVGTTSAMLQLVADGRVALDSPVVRYLPAFAPPDAPGKARITVRQLMTHSSGMPPWRPLYKETTDRAAALALALATRPDSAPGVHYAYSDLNFITLGALVARVTGESLDVYLARHVFTPLGMRDTRYRPPASDLARIAPTEYDPWRQRKLRGEVHDENAAALGGVSGHAGLFSTGADLARLARAYLACLTGAAGTLDGRRVFDSATVARFTRAQDTTVSRRALGWETPTGGNSAGHYLSLHAFGHTGFTGTSMWMDPERGVYLILLTNRVNPTRMNTKIGAVRVAFADGVMRALGVAPTTAPPPATASH
ncbi:D-alanyl-D-alanine carboxypeptidase [Gemmatimonadetes bacterium T265]|nr:D-alanyl-D-alanine carboxypeptidase [Gemmatimonadetes bacterium T265]